MQLPWDAALSKGSKPSERSDKSVSPLKAYKGAHYPITMQRTPQLELEAIPILLASSVTEVKQPLNPRLSMLYQQSWWTLYNHMYKTN